VVNAGVINRPALITDDYVASQTDIVKPSNS